MGAVDDAVVAYIRDLRDRGKYKLADQIDRAYTEVNQPKAQDVVNAILEDGLDVKEVVNIMAMLMVKEK